MFVVVVVADISTLIGYSVVNFAGCRLERKSGRAGFELVVSGGRRVVACRLWLVSIHDS